MAVNYFNPGFKKPGFFFSRVVLGKTATGAEDNLTFRL
jgi:hypothetical protein